MSEVITIENANLERDAIRHEDTLARLGGRGKFDWPCLECGSPDGMRSVHREILAMLSHNIMERLSWYREPGNDLVLYYSCWACNPDGKRTPNDWEPLSADEVLAWLNDDTDPMDPDYAALAAEPEAATAGEDKPRERGTGGIMNITEAMKDDRYTDLRISNRSRWMVWDEDRSAWIVYSREYAQKYTRTLSITKDEEEAIASLLYWDED